MAMSKKFKEFIVKYLDNEFKNDKIKHMSDLHEIYYNGFKEFYNVKENSKRVKTLEKYGINLNVDLSELLYVSSMFFKGPTDNHTLRKMCYLLTLNNNIKRVTRLIMETIDDSTIIGDTTKLIDMSIKMKYYAEGNIYQMFNKYFPNEFQVIFNSILQSIKLEKIVRRNYIKS